MKIETAMIIFGRNRLRWGLFIYADMNVDDRMMNLPGRDSVSEKRLEQLKKQWNHLLLIFTSVSFLPLYLEFVKPQINCTVLHC